MNNTKAIVFDAYGTLFDVNSAAEKCKDKIGDKWETFANYWRTTQLEYTWLRSLMRRHKDFWQITEDSLDKSMLAFKIDKSMRNELLNLYKELSTFPEVKSVLEELKKKYDKLYKKFVKGNFSEVIEGCNKVLKKRNHQLFFNLLSIAYQKSGKIEKSIDVMKEALALNPNNPNFLNNMGTCYYMMHKYSEAEKYFKKLAEMNETLALNHASMGMSADYLDAVKHGSTFVRIGSDIFGQRS